MDSQVQTVIGTNASPVELAGEFYGSKDTPTPVYLGEARTDEEGRLVVLAGRGLSFSIAQEGIKYPLILTDFDSPDWIDDTSDGWVSVTATHTVSTKTFVTFLVYLYPSYASKKIHSGSLLSPKRVWLVQRPSLPTASTRQPPSTMSWKRYTNKSSASARAPITKLAPSIGIATYGPF